MQLKKHWILGLYSDTSCQEVEIALILTDGLDILKMEKSFNRPYIYELKDKLLNITQEQLSDKKYVDTLEQEVTDFFIAVLQEAKEIIPPKPDYISIMGPIISIENGHVLEIGDLQKIATVIQTPVVGHFMQADLSAGGVGSPLNAVFWETMTHGIEKPLIILNIGGILKLTYLGVNGEILGFDVGIGTRLMDEWVFKKTGQSQDEDGWLSARGVSNKKVLKFLLEDNYLRKIPPKAFEEGNMDPLLEQLEGLTPEDGCATLVDFFRESLKKAFDFLPERPQKGIIVGGGLKNPSLILAIKKAFPNIQKATECFKNHENLNAMATAFLGGRRLMALPISLPSTTGVKEAISNGEIFDHELDR